jgi:putative transposase
MARQIRLEYGGAVYHVMARGNHGRAVYADDRDRQRWLGTLEEACDKTGWRIHAWVMMANHYHLLLETPEANLVAGMKWLQGTYTQRYNSRHGVFGHLFQGRYKALVVDGAAGNYFGTLSTYIHLNPARAGLIRIGEERLARYRWSSYPWYVKGSAERPGWLETRRVLGDLGLGAEGWSGYEAYVEGRVLELASKRGRQALAEEWKRIRRGWFLGSAEFEECLLERVGAILGRHRRASYSGAAKQGHGEAAAARWLARGLEAVQWETSQLAERPKGSVEKQVLAWWLCQHTTVRRRWVSERLGMGDESRVTQAIRRVQRGGDTRAERLKKRLESLYRSAEDDNK